ncbi:hypothetical protein H4Q32_015121 [Labeo rohita]|uniref:G-protein coupled receptors family 1 profile domain-containing protein n=1 Tax=Labeo rohita TaxID=84645 RepID=A0ABQ8LNK7_LABRO|nr:hypothetical protein H4Q32_015121 [Labeo rohita]
MNAVGMKMIILQTYCVGNCVVIFNKEWSIICPIIVFFLPAMIMSSLYVKIFCVAQKTCKERVTGGMNSQSSAHRERKAAKTLAVVMGVYLFCWLPFFTTAALDPFFNNWTPAVVFDALFWFAYFNSTCNPLIYGYWAICDPLRYRMRVTNNTVTAFITFIWLFSFLYSFSVVFSGINAVGMEMLILQVYCVGRCVLFFNKEWSIICPVLVFFLPGMIMSSLYVKIFHVAQKHAKVMSEKMTAGMKSQSSAHRERKAAKTLAIVMGVYLFCWLPVILVTIIDSFLNFVTPGDVLDALFWFAYFNSTCNPLIYGFFYPCFQKAFKILISTYISELLSEIASYWAICDPLRYKMRVTNNTVTAFITFIWLFTFVYSFSVVFSGMNAVGMEVLILQNYCVGNCVVFFNKEWSFICPVLLLFLPGTIMSSLYLKIFCVARKHAKVMSERVTAGRNSQSSAHRERKAAKTLAIVMGVYLLCWLPFYCCCSRPFFQYSTCNPLIYGFFYPCFQKAFKIFISTYKIISASGSYVMTSNKTQTENIFLCYPLQPNSCLKLHRISAVGLEMLILQTYCVGNCVVFFNKEWSIICPVLVFFLPGTIMSSLYVKIFCVAQKHAKVMSERVTGGRKNQSFAQRERKAAKTLAIVMGVYLFCWLPFFTAVALDPFFNNWTPTVVFDALFWFAYFNSTCNPLIYGFFYPCFQKAFKILISTYISSGGDVMTSNETQTENALLCYPLRQDSCPKLQRVNTIGLESFIMQVYCVGSCVLFFNKQWGLLCPLLTFFLPGTIMSSLYIKIFHVARKHAKVMSERVTGGMKSQSSAHRERKAAKTLAIVIGVFLFCWLPFFTVNALDPFFNFFTPAVVFDAVIWFAYLNSTCNPLIYGFFYPCFQSVNMIGLESFIMQVYCVGSCVLFFNKEWGIICPVLVFFLPGTIMSSLYVKIFHVAQKHAKVMSERMTGGSKSQSSAQRERKAAKTLAIVMGVYLFCWLPYFIVNALDPFLNFFTPAVVFDAVIWFAYFNSTCNPLIYGFFYPCFQSAFKILISTYICGVKDCNTLSLFGADVMISNETDTEDVFSVVFTGVNNVGLEELILQISCFGGCVLFFNKEWGLICALFVFLIPGTIMSSLYMSIFSVVKKHAKVLSEKVSGAPTIGANCQTSSQRERKAAKTLAIVMGVFYLCWLPFFTATAIDPFLNFVTPVDVFDALVWFGYFNSTCNPLIYGRPFKILISTYICGISVNKIGLESFILQVYCVGSCVLFFNKQWGLICSLLTFFLPGTIMSSLYMKIFHVARKHAKVMSERVTVAATGGLKSQSSAQREGKAAKTLAIVMGVFYLCWLPFFTATAVDPFLNFVTPVDVFDALVWFGYFNSTCNPLIYGFFYPRFQKAFKILISTYICGCNDSSTLILESI